MPTPRGLGKDARLLLSSYALFGVYTGMIMSIGQLYLKELGYPPSAVGALSFTSGMIGAALMLPVGVVADAYGRKAMLVISYAVGAVAAAVLALSSEFWHLAAAYALFGVSSAFLVPISALFSTTVPDEFLDVGFATLFATNLLAVSLGSLMGWLPHVLSDLVGNLLSAYRVSILLAAVVRAVATIPILLVREDYGGGERPSLSFKLPRAVWEFAAVTTLLGFGAGASIHLMGIYFGTKFGIGSGEFGTILFASQITMTLATAAVPLISAKMGTLGAATALQLASVPLLLGIAYASEFWLAGAFYVARSVFMNMASPLVESLKMKLVSRERRATMSAATALVLRVANSVGSAVGGFLMDHVWLELPLHLTAALYATYSILLYLLFRRG